MRSLFHYKRQLGILAICIIFSLQNPVLSQSIGGIRVAWDGNPHEWTLYADDSWEEELGTLETRWNDRYDIWDYRIGEETGMIRMKWKGNPDFWELKANNRIITFEAVWKGTWDTWRVTDGNYRIKVSVRDRNIMEEWEMEKNDACGNWAMWTEYQNDMGSWVIMDELFEDINDEIRMALLFIPIIVHFPKD